VKTVKVQYRSEIDSAAGARLVASLHWLAHVSGWGGCYRLDHHPIEFHGLLHSNGLGPGSMYSQAYVSIDGIGGQSASIAPCDRVS